MTQHRTKKDAFCACLMSFGVLVYSCGGGGVGSSFPAPDDTSPSGDRKQDIPVQLADGADVLQIPDGAEGILAPDTELRDLVPEDGDAYLPDSASVCDTFPKPFGCPCTSADDCESGWCVDTDSGRICTQVCTDQCPRGYGCFGVTGAWGRDVTYLCLPRFSKLCQPCRAAADCQAKGSVGITACINYGPEGMFCGGECTSSIDCPTGYECRDVALPDGTPSRQCVLISGTCQCNTVGKVLGMSTECSVSNQYGTCKGERRCLADGLSGCDAPTPSLEVCDLKDNDCNGITDDLPANTPCLVENEYGKCPGTLTCSGGREVCIGSTPAPENCDGLDNNCNGFTDEGFADTDKDGRADCIDPDDDNDGVPDEIDNCPLIANPDQADLDMDHQGDVCDGDMDGDGFPNIVDCDPADGQTYPGAHEVCDGKDNNCNGEVDEGLCNDGIACTFDYCDPVVRECKHVGDDHKCDDKNPCTFDRCDPQVGCIAEPLSGVPCDDGDICTVSDACVQGFCKGTPIPGCCRTSADCDDNNPCTFDRCDVSTGTCSHDASALENKPCDADQNGCTKGDVCRGGICTPGDTVDCGAAPLQCMAATCVSTGSDTYTCEMLPQPRGTPCDDGDPCTVMDQCDGAGVCVPGVQSPSCCKKNEDCSDGNPCTLDVCNLQTGQCLHLPVGDGTPCDADSNGCTQGDSCKQGVCVPGANVTCPAPQDPCYQNRCVSIDATSYRCEMVPSPAGVSCDDGSPCTAGDACDGNGLCLGTPVPNCCRAPSDCDDSNPCTTDTCNVLTGKCVHVPVSDGTQCNADNNGCTTNDQCIQGVCVPGAPVQCPPAPSCYINNCVSTGANAYTCQLSPAPAGTVCDDGQVCTQNDACDGNGVCRGTPVANCCRTSSECNDNNPCTTDVCDVATGRCSYQLVADNTPCNADNDGCTQGDKCLQGSCVPGPRVDCGAGANPCVVKTCRSTGANTYTCESSYADQTVPCDDGRFCTVQDHCDGSGNCVGGAPLDCGATSEGCVQAVCSETEKKCIITPKPDGTPCNADNNGCTVGDACVNGTCMPGRDADCHGVGDQCNQGVCESLAPDLYRCIRQPKAQGAPCEDGRFCTINDQCDGNGSCVSGADRDCGAEVGDQCNTGYCDEQAKACVQVKKPDGTLCDDGDVCTLEDTCQNGQCTGSGNACVEERINVAGPGARRPSVGSLGYGRYVTQWEGDGAAQAYLRLSDNTGSRENEEVQLTASGDGAQWSSPIAVQSSGNFLALSWSGASSGSCGGCTCTASFSGSLKGTLFKFDGSVVSSKSLRAFSASYYGCYPSVQVLSLRAIPLAFSDGTFGLVDSWQTSGSGNPAHLDIRFEPLASDLTPGSTTVLVPASNMKAADRYDARLVPDGSDTFLLAWVGPTGTKVFAQRFTKTGQKDMVNDILVVDTGSQEVFGVRVATFVTGQFIVFWDANGADGSGRGIYGQRFYPDGTPSGQAFRVNQNINGDQRLGDVGVFSDAGFVVVFDDATGDVNGYAVKFVRYNAQGQVQGSEVRVNTQTPGDQILPTVGVLPQDQFVVAYVDSNKVVWTRRFYKDGTPYMGKVEIRANTTKAGSQVNPQGAVAQNGNFMVVWESPVFGKEISEVMGRVFNSIGNEVKGEFQVNVYDKDSQNSPVVAGGPDRFIVVWDSVGQDGSVDGIFARLFYSDGTPIGTTEFRVNKTTSDFQRQPAVGMTQGGISLVAWNGYSTVTGSISDIFAAIFDKDGNRLVDEFQVNLTVPKGQENPAVVGVPGRAEFLVGWESKDQDGSGYGVYIRKFNSSGQGLSDEVQVNTTSAGDQKNISLAVSQDASRVIACWDSYGQDAPNTWGVVCQIFNYQDLSKAGNEFIPHALTAGSQQLSAVTFLPGGEALVAWASEGVDSGGLGVQVRRLSATGQPYGPRIVANRYWSGNQTKPFILALSSSSYVVGWESEGQDGDGTGIYFRILPPPQ